MPNETAVHEQHEHVFLPQHRHHFETEEQQREAGSFGMWLFLLTEIMFFGGMFFAYLLYRNWYYDAFVPASNQLNVALGGANTAILITSGFFMALGVWAAEVQKKGLLVLFLILTTVFGCAFLGIKYVEYHEKWEKHHIPGASFDISEFVNPPRAAGTGHGAEDTDLLLSVFRDDRDACVAHDYRPGAAGVADRAGAAWRFHGWVCGAD